MNIRTFALALAVGTAAASDDAAQAETLDSAVEAALTASPILAAARTDYLSSTAGVALAAARGRLQLAFSSRVTHDFEDDDPYLPKLRDETSLRFTLPLYSGGRVQTSVAAARLRASASAEDIKAQIDGLQISVVEKYDQVLDAVDRVQIQQNEVDALRRELVMINNERSEGSATRTDQALGGARLSLAQARLEAAVGHRDEVRVAYQQVVGDTADGLTEPAMVDVSGGVDELTAEALRHSHSLESLHDRIEAAAHDVRVARGLGRPTLSLTGAVGYGNTDMRLAETPAFPHRVFASVGISLSIPFYSGGQISAEAARARAALQQEEDEAEIERRRLTAEVRTSYFGYKGALNRLTATEMEHEAAQRAYDGTLVEHKAGTRTDLDLLNAQNELSQTAGAMARARREAHLEAVVLLVRAGSYIKSEARRDAARAPGGGRSNDRIMARVDFDLARMPGSVASVAGSHT